MTEKHINIYVNYLNSNRDNEQREVLIKHWYDLEQPDKDFFEYLYNKGFRYWNQWIDIFPNERINLRNSRLKPNLNKNNKEAEIDFTHYNFINSPVDFTGSKFECHISFGYKTFTQEVYFNNVEFHGIANFIYTTFEKSVLFQKCIFQKNALFYETEFKGNLLFKTVEFKGVCNLTCSKHYITEFSQVFVDNADISFIKATIKESLTFRKIRISKAINLSKSNIQNNINIDNSGISQTNKIHILNIYLNNATVANFYLNYCNVGLISLYECRCDSFIIEKSELIKNLHCHYAICNRIKILESTFNIINMNHINIQSDTNIKRNTINEGIFFECSKLKNGFSLSENQINGEINFSKSLIDKSSIYISKNKVSRASSIFFEESWLDSSTLKIEFEPKQGTLSFHKMNCSNSSLNLIKIRKNYHEKSCNLRLSDIAGQHSKILLKNFHINKSTIIKNSNISELFFDECSFSDSLIMNNLIIEKSLTIKKPTTKYFTIPTSLNFRYCIFNGVFHIDDEILSNQEDVMDLRDTKISNVPILNNLKFKKYKAKNTFMIQKNLGLLIFLIPSIFYIMGCFLFEPISSTLNLLQKLKRNLNDWSTKFMQQKGNSLLILLYLACLGFGFDQEISHISRIQTNHINLNSLVIEVSLLIFLFISVYNLYKYMITYNSSDESSYALDKANKLCRLKSISNQNGDHRLALDFLIEENKTKRYAALNIFGSLLDTCMEYCSDYGRSILKPAIFLIIFNFAMLGFYDKYFENHTDSLSFTKPLFLNTLAPMTAGIQRYIRQDLYSNHDHFDQEERLSLDILIGIHGSISTFFVFFIVLAIRNRYKMK